MSYIEPHKLLITPENRSTADFLYLEIVWYLNNHEVLPCDIVKKFLSLIINEDEHRFQSISQEVSDCYKKATERALSVRGYNLSFNKYEVINDKKIKTKIATEDILYHGVVAYLLYKKDVEVVTKDATVIFFYSFINEYLGEELIKRYKKEITFYKRKVLAGILTLSMGYMLTNKTPLINKYIFKSVDDIVESKKVEKINLFNS